MMHDQMSATWKQELEQAVRRAKAEVLGVRQVAEAYHARLMLTAVQAFGDDARAVLFAECQPVTGRRCRPDLILLHPDTGVVVIENKGVRPEDIHAADGTTLKLVRDGRLQLEDPFHQAERAMFALRDLIKLRADLREALFLRTAALPRVGRDEFERRFGVRWPDETLFAEECGSPERFRSHLVGFADHTQRTARLGQKLSKRAHDAVVAVLSGRGFLSAPRPTHVETEDRNLLGVQVQELEEALKQPTEQQLKLGRGDLRGNHRLFRGVAGSGKSVMLALSVATTLQKYREEADTLFAEASAPPKRVLVVCFNKTLVHYLSQKIEERFGRLAWDKPDPDALTVTHFEGLIRRLVATAPSLDTGLGFEERGRRAERTAEAFERLDAAVREPLLYDAVYIDEAQDLAPEEVRLLLRLARRDQTGAQTFVVFYDNAQNIYGTPLPVWHDLGVNIVGRTEFLDTCLRNTRQTLGFAFNVLVGSHAAEGQRATTRQFADVASLRDRKLIAEENGRFDIRFASRTGPVPEVTVYPDRQAEAAGVAGLVRRLVHEQRVLPSDILVLYRSHWAFKDAALPERLERAVGPRYRVRSVDRQHDANKNFPLLEDGVLTASTIASAKGYDAPVVILAGADALGTETQDRATFYVGATRAKLMLYVSGVTQGKPTLIDEIVLAAGSPAPRSPTPTVVSVGTTAVASGPHADSASSESRIVCRFCGRQRLHAQHGRFGYFFRCIDCMENTPIPTNCSRCGNAAMVRKRPDDFFRTCAACGHEQLVHRNVPLESP